MKKLLNNIPYKIIIGSANFNKKYGFKKQKIKISDFNYFTNYLIKNGINQLDWSFDYSNENKLIEKFYSNGFLIDTKISKNNFYQDINYFSNSHINKIKFNSVYIRSPEELNMSDFAYIYKTLIFLKEKKQIKKIGYSIYNINKLHKKKLPMPDTIQVPINLFDQRLLKSNYLDLCKKNNVEVCARSIFLQGKLLNPYFTKKYTKFLRYNQLSPIQATKSFFNLIYRKNVFDKVIIGIENLNNLKEFFETRLLNLKYDYFKNLSTLNSNIIDPRLWKY